MRSLVAIGLFAVACGGNVASGDSAGSASDGGDGGSGGQGGSGGSRPIASGGGRFMPPETGGRSPVEPPPETGGALTMPPAVGGEGPGPGLSPNPTPSPEWFPGETPVDLCGAFRNLLARFDRGECACAQRPFDSRTAECGGALGHLLNECNALVVCRSECAYCPLSERPCGAETCGCEETCMNDAPAECVELYYLWERCALDSCPCCSRVGAPCMTDAQCCVGRCAQGVCARE